MLLYFTNIIYGVNVIRVVPFNLSSLSANKNQNITQQLISEIE